MEQNMMQNYLKLHRLLDKARTSDKIREELKSNPSKVFQMEGIVTKKKKIKFYENTAKDVYFVIPFDPLDSKDKVNHLSNNPSLSEIGRYVITQVQAKTAVGKQILADPWKALEDHGADLPKLYNIHIIQAEKDCAYFVIPRKDEEDEELNNLELKALSGGKGGGSKSSSTKGLGTQAGLDTAMFVGAALL